jgi:TP901 family phage tail tape measure protein
MANALEILITGKDQFSPKAQKAQRSAKNLQGGMASLGKTVLGVGAGFIAAQASIAGVSKLFTSTIGAAIKFEAQLAQIRALTGATKKDTDFLSGAIKDLSKEIGKSPAELGAGAYFILSSGIEDAAEAAEVLEVAAKASTIGLGETERVADALTTVLNAYGMEASNAGHVTDVMIEAVKQGKAEASAFAGVLGRVVPLASQMGISFEEVSANLATFTRLGVSAEEAATGLRAVMNALINPTDQTRETMGELGLSVEGLRKQIKEKGLLSALDSMMMATGGNEEALSKLFPNIRALTSVLGTAGVQLEDYTNILAATENATGNLEEGFGIVSATTQQKVKVAMAELNIALMDMGTIALPLVASAAEGAAKGFDVLAFSLGNTETALSDLERAALKGIPVIGDLQMLAGNKDDWDKMTSAVGFMAEAFDNTFTGFPEHAVKMESLRDETRRMIEKAEELAEVMANEVAPRTVFALDDIREAASNTRSALTSMFREPTQEEAEAAAVLADYRLELGQLEAASEGAADAEGSRAAQLKNDLIPAIERELTLLGLEKDAIEKGAAAMALGLPTLAEHNEEILRGAQNLERLNQALSVTTNFRGFDITVQQAGLFQGRLHGGPVSAGQAVLVGEKRPEIFVPDRAGTILPDARMGGGGLTVNINGVFAGDERTAMELANLIAPEIRRMMN